MRADRKLLPSMSMLASFDAAARTGSVSEAARELNVTHGAVSRQIHALEDQLGVPLFRRSTRGLELTEAGARYATDVHSIMSTLRSASLKIISDPTGSTINLAVLPTFGTRWLIPRLPDFLRQQPDITVNFVSLSERSPRDIEGIDVAINYGRSAWPDAHSEFLIGEHARPVCSPQLLGGRNAGSDAALAALPLLALRDQRHAWAEWFAYSGLDYPADGVSMECEQVAALTQAAIAGLGVALLPPFLIEPELERGLLITLSERATEWEIGYHLVTPNGRREYEPVVAFRRWLFATIDRERKSANLV